MTVDIASLPALGRGKHDGVDGDMCVMEAVAYVAGEPWSDAPVCACPVISTFLRTWNDSLDDADRDQLLRPLIPVIIGTRSTATVKQRRAAMAVDWLIRCQAPAWLRLAGLTIQAETLEALPEVTDFTQCQLLMPALISVQNDASDAWDAAKVAAWAAASSAAWAAAWDAAMDAANAAAGDAASSAARDAARDTAWDAASSAAWVATGVATAAGAAAAAKSALAPTITALQASALDLVHRMIAVTETAT